MPTSLEDLKIQETITVWEAFSIVNFLNCWSWLNFGWSTNLCQNNDWNTSNIFYLFGLLKIALKIPSSSPKLGLWPFLLTFKFGISLAMENQCFHCMNCYLISSSQGYNSTITSHSPQKIISKLLKILQNKFSGIHSILFLVSIQTFRYILDWQFLQIQILMNLMHFMNIFNIASMHLTKIC